MLAGDHHGVHPHRLAVGVFHRHLGFSVGTEIGEDSLLAYRREPFCHLMGKRNGQRHQLRGLVTGVAEHHALISCADAEPVLHFSVFRLQRLVHAHGDVRGLGVQRGDHGAGIAVEAVFCPVIADLSDGFPHDLLDIHIRLGGDLAHDADKTCGDEGLAGDAGAGVLPQHFVKDRIGDLVADLVRMALGH